MEEPILRGEVFLLNVHPLFRVVFRQQKQRHFPRRQDAPVLLAAHAAELGEVAFAEELCEEAVEQGWGEMGGEGEGEEEEVCFLDGLGGEVVGEMVV